VVLAADRFLPPWCAADAEVIVYGDANRPTVESYSRMRLNSCGRPPPPPLPPPTHQCVPGRVSRRERADTALFVRSDT